MSSFWRTASKEKQSRRHYGLISRSHFSKEEPDTGPPNSNSSFIFLPGLFYLIRSAVSNPMVRTSQNIDFEEAAKDAGDLCEVRLHCPRSLARPPPSPWARTYRADTPPQHPTRAWPPAQRALDARSPPPRPGRSGRAQRCGGRRPCSSGSSSPGWTSVPRRSPGSSEARPAARRQGKVEIFDLWKCLTTRGSECAA